MTLAYTDDNKILRIHDGIYSVRQKVMWRSCSTLQRASSPLREITCHNGITRTCHRAEVTLPLPLPHQPIKAGNRLSDPGETQGRVDLVGLVTYRGGIPAPRRSPVPVLTGLKVEQLGSCDERH